MIPATHPGHAARPAAAFPLRGVALPVALLLALLLRVAAWIAVAPPLQSDGLSYFTMARNLAQNGVLLDNYGLQIFYSAGYPLLLTPFFAMFGASVTTVLAVNLLLAALSLWLIHRIALMLSGLSTAEQKSAIQIGRAHV